jgi:hypothetical protein
VTVRTDVPKYIPGRGAAKKMNPEYVALWEPYLDEGMAAKHVGQIFGVDQVTVARYYPGRQWTYDQARELAAMNRHMNRVLR